MNAAVGFVEAKILYCHKEGGKPVRLPFRFRPAPYVVPPRAFPLFATAGESSRSPAEASGPTQPICVPEQALAADRIDSFRCPLIQFFPVTIRTGIVVIPNSVRAFRPRELFMQPSSSAAGGDISRRPPAVLSGQKRVAEGSFRDAIRRQQTLMRLGKAKDAWRHA